MLDTIKRYKQEYIAKLTAQKNVIENQRAQMIASNYALKKVENDKECEKLDQVLAGYINEKQAAFNAEIEAKRKEVAEKKAEMERVARTQAETEACAEIAVQTAAYEEEIARVLKEIE